MKNCIIDIKSKQKAREMAIKWQEWQSKRSISYKEVTEWTRVFEKLANKFNLKKEFKENGII